jgi:hypothetical protein
LWGHSEGDHQEERPGHRGEPGADKGYRSPTSPGEVGLCGLQVRIPHSVVF